MESKKLRMFKNEQEVLDAIVRKGYKALTRTARRLRLRWQRGAQRELLTRMVATMLI
jgi:hypothetical protein